MKKRPDEHSDWKKELWNYKYVHVRTKRIPTNTRGIFSSGGTKVNIGDVYTFYLLYFFNRYNVSYIGTLIISNIYFRILK